MVRTTQLNHPFYASIINGLLLLCMTLLLSSCSHIARNDGPPGYYVNENAVHDAEPKPEPMAKYGNMSSYVVFGKRYYVMKSSKNYDATGTASWYGTKFHAHRTSSGERYNMLSMSAAHKTLPLPTYVYVTNLKNHRAVIVKVNDRGPFESNRLIDLSYVAAKKLGMVGHGTAHVRVQAIDSEAYAKSPTNYLASLQGHSSKTTSFSMPEPVLAYERPNTKYHHVTPMKHLATASTNTYHATIFLQAGAFRNKINAHQLKQRLASIVKNPVSIESPTSKNHLYRVQIGPFRNRTEAENVTHHLQRIGIHTSRVSGA